MLIWFRSQIDGVVQVIQQLTYGVAELTSACIRAFYVRIAEGELRDIKTLRLCPVHVCWYSCDNRRHRVVRRERRTKCQIGEALSIIRAEMRDWLTRISGTGIREDRTSTCKYSLEQSWQRERCIATRHQILGAPGISIDCCRIFYLFFLHQCTNTLEYGTLCNRNSIAIL